MCSSAAPEWDIDFQVGSFHYSMPATLNLDYSIFSKSQKHRKSTCSRVLGQGEDDLYFCFNEIPCGKRTGHDAGRLEALLHNFPHQSIPWGICIHPTLRYLHTSWPCLLQCCDVIYFSDLVIPLSCVKVQRHSVTEMDWAVNLPHRSPQTHSLCHRYPEAAAASFSSFPSWTLTGERTG